MTKPSDATLNAKEVFENQLKHEINLEDLKITKYMKKIKEGFDDNCVKLAYSYYDKANNNLYLYLPQKNKLTILEDYCNIRHIKLQ